MLLSLLPKQHRLANGLHAAQKLPQRKRQRLACSASVQTVRSLTNATLHELPGGQLVAPLLGPDTDETLPFAVALELSPHGPSLSRTHADSQAATYALQYILEGRGEVCFGSLAQHSQRVQAGDTVLSPTGAGQYIPDGDTNAAEINRKDSDAEGVDSEVPGQLARLVLLLPKELFNEQNASDISAYMRSYESVESTWSQWKQQPAAGTLSAQEVLALLSKRQRPLPPGSSPPPPHAVGCSAPMSYTIFPQPHPAQAHAPPIHTDAPTIHTRTVSPGQLKPQHEEQHSKPQHSNPSLQGMGEHAGPVEHEGPSQGPSHGGPAGYLAGLVHVHDQLVNSSHALLRQAFAAVNLGEHGTHGRTDGVGMGVLGLQLEHELQGHTLQIAHAGTTADTAQPNRLQRSLTWRSTRKQPAQQNGQRGKQHGSGAPLVMKRALDDLDTFQLPNQTNMLAIVFDPLEHAVPFTFGIEVFQSGHKTSPHVHTHAHELFFILSGEGEGFCNGERFPVSAGDLVLFPPGSVHGIDVSDSGKMFCLEFMLPNQQFVELVRTGQVAQLDADALCQLNVISC